MRGRCAGRRIWGPSRVLAVAAAIVTGAGTLSGCGESSTNPGPVHVSVASPTAPAAGTPAAFVDPLMGTGVGGTSVGAIDTFPGADVPFGMLQWSPDTSPDRASGGGYAYGDSAISGFSLTHMSGPGCPFYGDIPILPTVGAIGSDPQSATAPFTHATEVAHPGSYAVTVGASPVRVELAVTARAGLGRFTFPGTGEANVLFKVADSAAGSTASDVSIVGHDEVDGSVLSGGFCGTSGDYRLFFAARFETPFTGFGTWHDSTIAPGSRSSDRSRSGGYVTFGSSTRVVQMQVGVSYVNLADARLNIAADQPGWDIDTLAQQDSRLWNELLGRIQVSGGSPAEVKTFYSALYKSLLHPNVFDDANSDYLGFDGRVHDDGGTTQYTNFSEWDIYRSEMALLALLAPQQTSDMVTSLLTDAAQGGGLPKWAVANSDAGQGNGDSADPVIADAYAFGARDFDVSTALADMVRGATDPTVMTSGHPERQDLAQYMAQGWVNALVRDFTSFDYTVGGSETLEYAIDDFAISQLALAAGDTAKYATFIARAQNWEHLVNPATGYLGARRADGTFPPGPAFQPSPQPDIGQVGFEEGNAIQYTWSVPQNLHGLFDALGGDAAVVSKLDTFFTKLNTSRKQPYDWAGNEPSLGIPWEYDYAGDPSGTQSVVRRIVTSLYSATPDGEPGNDDLGAMASWYVWAAMGLYPEVPGRGELVLGSPLFAHVALTLPDGRSVVIGAPDASPSTPYVQSLQVHGLAPGANACTDAAGSGGGTGNGAGGYDCPWLPASATVTGAQLDFSLGSSPPDTAWGNDPADAPPSFPSP